MLITLCYVYIWVRFQRCYSQVIRSTLRRLYASNSAVSLTFCALNAPPGPSGGPHRSTPNVNTRWQPVLLPPEDAILLQLGDKAVYVSESQNCEDLTKWTVLLGSCWLHGPLIDNISFIVEAAAGHERASSPSSPAPETKVLKWSDYCLPLACLPGAPYRTVAQANVDDFSQLGVAFLEDRLQLEDGLTPLKIVSVLLKERALQQLLENHPPQSHKDLISLLVDNAKAAADPRPREKLSDPRRHEGRCLLPPEVQRSVAGRRGSDPHLYIGNDEDSSDSQSQEASPCSLGDLLDPHPPHHLHLASCHECLELENSTILSVKYASTEDLPDLPVDPGSSSLPGGGASPREDMLAQDTVGQDGVMEDKLAQAAEDSLGRAGATSSWPRGEESAWPGPGPLSSVSSKPPNVLVYTGGCQQRFQSVQQLLGACLAGDSHTVYPLLPLQALGEPWAPAARLLVLAEDQPLPPQLQACFLRYLGQGGRVLGLCSSLCPPGVSLQPRGGAGGKVGRLHFARGEGGGEVELGVLASGRAYVNTGGAGGVDRWGELRGGGELVIVRVAHGNDGGEAVLCQVHLEQALSEDQVTSDLQDVRLSDTLRCQVAMEILTSLGLSCEPVQAPPPSSVYILATSPEERASFVTWLQTQADGDGLLRFSPRAPFRLLSQEELRSQAPPEAPPEAPVALVTDPPGALLGGELFCPDTYLRNLTTQSLGRTLLYAHVATSTMDLLEGMACRLPADRGLIAVAGQQSKGRGRRGNAWLSPAGCAMFTVSVQLEQRSRLGRRIPFLQHLAALAVVEAVRTMPGYEDVDLRVKWPNDIYYSNHTKLGGVLVTSTVMGTTFHLLVGCGVNVSNSRPTLCLNDLVQQRDLPALSPARVIAASVSALERLICAFQQGGAEAVLPLYYSRWMHSGTRVHLRSEDGPEAEVLGLDDNGFLQVLCQEQGVVSLEPDGNSFDMLTNLLISRQ